jgi:hypothetical protein
MIDNPEYEAQADVYKLPPLKFVGFELWQARARSRLQLRRRACALPFPESGSE